MKKKVWVLSLFFLFFLVACNTQNEEQPVNNGSPNDEVIEVSFRGTIEEISSESSAIVAVDSGDILNSADKVTIDLTQADDQVTFEVGDQVLVTYDGIVRESYPAQINTLSVEKIE